MHVRTCSLRSSHAAMDTIVQYIVKEDGRNAVEDIYIPQLETRNRKNQNDICEVILRLITLK